MRIWNIANLVKTHFMEVLTGDKARVKQLCP